MVSGYRPYPVRHRRGVPLPLDPWLTANAGPRHLLFGCHGTSGSGRHVLTVHWCCVSPGFPDPMTGRCGPDGVAVRDRPRPSRYPDPRVTVRWYPCSGVSASATTGRHPCPPRRAGRGCHGRGVRLSGYTPTPACPCADARAAASRRIGGQGRGRRAPARVRSYPDRLVPGSWSPGRPAEHGARGGPFGRGHGRLRPAPLRGRRRRAMLRPWTSPGASSTASPT